MNGHDAEILALRALGWAAEAEGVLSRFTARSGLKTDDLRRQAGDPELLAAVLDFVLAEDSLARAFCEQEGVDARQLHLARALLPGGESL